jgi:protein-tyrosine phosphatase
MLETISRRLTWDACYNIRDLGGYATARGATRWGVYVRGDSLIRLSPTGCAALRNYGIRTIIDLRSSHEHTSGAHPFSAGSGFGHPLYRAMPLFDESNDEAMSWVSAARTLAELYETMLHYFPAQIVAVMRSLANAPSGGVLFHCHAGKDRTGLIAMFLLAIAGVNDETIIADYAVSDQFLGPLYDQILAQYINQPSEHRRVALSSCTGAAMGRLATCSARA